jgi:redox-sensitive bicupin YhaK (pirin superfamily)
VFQGEAKFSAADGAEQVVQSPKLVVLSAGDFVEVATADNPARFLLVSGRPLREPVARYGPFVMNTREEIEEALDDLRRGTFV